MGRLSWHPFFPSSASHHCRRHEAWNTWKTKSKKNENFQVSPSIVLRFRIQCFRVRRSPIQIICAFFVRKIAARSTNPVNPVENGIGCLNTLNRRSHERNALPFFAFGNFICVFLHYSFRGRRTPKMICILCFAHTMRAHSRLCLQSITFWFFFFHFGFSFRILFLLGISHFCMCTNLQTWFVWFLHIF